MDLKAELLADIFKIADIKASADGMSRAAIARAALNDNTFFTRLERGENFTVDTYLRVSRWISENWPEGVDWPEGVKRPVPTEVAS